MMFEIQTVQGDITKVRDIEAIVNAANNSLLGGGGVDGEFNDADALKIIASLPSREVLIAKMLGSMLAPISKLAYVLNAIAEKQEAQA